MIDEFERFELVTAESLEELSKKLHKILNPGLSGRRELHGHVKIEEEYKFTYGQWPSYMDRAIHYTKYSQIVAHYRSFC